MKTKILFIKMFVLSCMLFTLGFTAGSCSDDDDVLRQDMDMLSSNFIKVFRQVHVPVRMSWIICVMRKK